MRYFAIDPGPERSGWCAYDPGNMIVLNGGIDENEHVKNILRSWGECDTLIECYLASYNVRYIGATVVNTVLWTGRFLEASCGCGRSAHLIHEPDVRLVLCGNKRAKETQMRQRVRDILGPLPTKKQPSKHWAIRPTSHVWSAVALCLAWPEIKQQSEVMK